MPGDQTRAKAIQYLSMSQVQLVKIAKAVLLLVTFTFFALTFLHLRADFPYNTTWNDPAKMTDEGWYSNGAIHLLTLGHWYAPETFNPSVALPVWPLMLVPWFQLFGVHMASARALTVFMYGLTLLLMYLVLRRTEDGLVPFTAVALMAVNPFCYAFNRLAILEPLMVFWLMLGFWVAGRRDGSPIRRAVLTGIVIAGLVLTKTTGLILVPAIVYYWWASSARTGTRFLRPLAISIALLVGIFMTYLLLVFWSGHLGDLRTFFSINNDHLYRGILRTVAGMALTESLPIGKVLVPVAFLTFALSIIWIKELWQKPLFVACVMSIVSYLAFVAFHTKFPPRYYLVLAAPVTIIALLGVVALWRRQPVYAAPLIGLLLASGVSMMVRTAGFVRHPQYRFAQAAEGMARIMHADASAHPVLLSSSGDDISLFVGIPAISPEYTAHGETALLNHYHPDFYAAWDNRPDLRMTARLSNLYSLVEKGRYTAFDETSRRTLVLYKLLPKR